MMRHMIETCHVNGLEGLKTSVERLLLRGWIEVERGLREDGWWFIVLEREGDKSDADDLAVQTVALEAEVKRVEAGGEFDPEFFEKRDRMRA